MESNEASFVARNAVSARRILQRSTRDSSAASRYPEITFVSDLSPLSDVHRNYIAAWHLREDPRLGRS